MNAIGGTIAGESFAALTGASGTTTVIATITGTGPTKVFVRAVATTP